MITVTTEPGRYLISAPAGTKDSNPQLKAAVAEAKEMAKLFGFKVTVVRDRGVVDDFQTSSGDRAPSQTRKNVEIGAASAEAPEIEGA